MCEIKEGFCVVKGCDDVLDGKNFCAYHARKLHRLGVIGFAPRQMRGLSLEQRFEVCFEPKRMPNGCLEATRGIGTNGYPVLNYNRKHLSGNQAALILAGHPRPHNRSMACHRCDNKRCVDAEHLYWGDAQTNRDDRRMRNHNDRSRLSPDVVATLREMYESGCALREIERRAGVTRASIKRHLGLPMSPAFAKKLPRDDPRWIEADA